MSSFDIEELIALVRKKPQVWDRGNRFHSNRLVLDKCWREIASELKEDENKLRKKWKYLRDQFSVEYGKIPPAGCAEEMMSYEPKWRYYKPLQFLEEVVTPRANSKNPRREDDTSESMETDGSSVYDGGKRRFSQRGTEAKKHKRHMREKQKLKRPDAISVEHMHFFKSLLPHVRSIPLHLQLSFRSRVQELVEEFAYRADPTAPEAPKTFGPKETYFITCVPDHTTKFEPPESVDESQDNQDDDCSS